MRLSVDPTMSDDPEQLCELSGVRQHADEAKRRWFFTRSMDLIVWVDEFDRPFKFQLCYEKRTTEYALTWEPEKGFDHAVVDSGPTNASKNVTPILRRSDDTFDREYLLGLFQVSNSNLPPSVGGLVSEALSLYPSSPIAPGRRPVVLLPTVPSARRPATTNIILGVIMIAAVIAFAWATS